MLLRLCVFLCFSLLSSSLLAAKLDPANLDLASVSVVVKDLGTGEVLFQRNEQRVQPIASITKLMTALVTLDASQSLNEKIPIEVKDIPIMRNVDSRVRIGSEIPRGDVLLIALMSSENRAAASLGHSYPGGVKGFIDTMNRKAQALNMPHTHYEEPTGLSENNVSTASDLMRLIEAAGSYREISAATTASKKDVFFSHPKYALAFYNTNPLVNKKQWNISLSKTGYTDDAGRCLVMRTTIAGRDIGLVLLDSLGKLTHLADAQRIRRWLETGYSGKVPQGAANYRDAKLTAMAVR